LIPKNELQILVSSLEDDTKEGLKIHQNAQLSRMDLSEGTSYTYETFDKQNGVYIMNISGNFIVEEEELSQRDAIGVSDTSKFTVTAKSDAEILFIEIPIE
jgi:redox-sensitive bicupin YhaK (pirin superfamily)